MSVVEDRFMQYGVASDLADKAVAAALTVTKVRSLSQKDMVSKFGMTADDAKELSRCVQRAAMDKDTVQHLLEASNFTCNVCKGLKGSANIIHHIEEYEIGQDNSYNNLIVLCPNDHDLAHRGGLTLGLKPEQLRTIKGQWEL